MAFSSWEDFRTAVKDALADYVAGEPFVGEFDIPGQSGRRIKYRSFDDCCNLIPWSYRMEALENAGQRSSRVSYGRYRRFS